MRHAALQLATPDQLKDRIFVVTYHDAETHFCTWTGFDERVVYPGDVVLYGYAGELLEYLQKTPQDNLPARYKLNPLSIFDNYYHKASRFALETYDSQGNPSKGPVVLNFYESKDHGWGNLSAETMKRAAELGASEVIYFSKGATCESPECIYEKVYCPTKYVVSRYDKIMASTQGHLRNRFVEAFPTMGTGTHFSPPCVMEEDFNLSRVAHDEVGASSLDNEAAQIAVQIEQTNKRLQRDRESSTSFTAIQFPTDYIRKPHEASLQVKFDLKNNRGVKAEEKRTGIMLRIFEALRTYVVYRAYPETDLPLPISTSPEGGYISILETRSCYQNHVLPLFEQSPVMSCLADIIKVKEFSQIFRYLLHLHQQAKNYEDLRSSPDGELLLAFLPTRGGLFIAVPRPEVHPPAESWSFDRMRKERRFAFVAFWLHPDWTTEEWSDKVRTFAYQNRPNGQPGTSNTVPPRISSDLHKQHTTTGGPYYHSIRDIKTQEDYRMLSELRRQIDEFVIPVFGVRIGGDKKNDVQCFVQYPSGRFSSTLHVHFWFGYEEGEDELNRKIAVDELLHAQAHNTLQQPHQISRQGEKEERAWTYRLHRLSNAYQTVIARLPHFFCTSQRRPQQTWLVLGAWGTMEEEGEEAVRYLNGATTEESRTPNWDGKAKL